MGKPLEPDQIADISRLKHIFQNNDDIARDYWQQLQDGVKSPTLNREMLYNVLNSDDEGSKDDAQRYRAFISYATSSAGRAGFSRYGDIAGPVSYTHLTLPTTPYV